MESFKLKKEIKNDAIEELREPIKNILEILRPKIEEGKYDLIIGDDASGRIPALILHNVITSAYGHKNYEKPQILFIAGAKYTNLNEVSERIRAHLEKHIRHYNNKTVLVVTEYVDTGESIEPLQAALKSLGMQYEIATVGASSLPNNTRFIVGEKNDLPRIFGKSHLSGVIKNRGEILGRHANQHESNIDLPESIKIGKTIYEQKDINDAREDVKLISDDLSRLFK